MEEIRQKYDHCKSHEQGAGNNRVDGEYTEKREMHFMAESPVQCGPIASHLWQVRVKSSVGITKSISG